MEAFAICGIDHTTTTDDDEEHAQVIVDVAVIAADAAVEAPWERCVGETNVGLGLRRVGIAVRKAARTEAPAYVVDARISATRPGNDRGWTACAQLHGANPSLSSGGLTGSLRAPLLLWRRVAAPSDRAAPLVALRLTTGTPQKPWAPLSIPSATQFPRTTALFDRRGQARLYGIRAPPMKAPPQILASWGRPPPRLADLVFDDDASLTRKPRDSLTFEEFSFSLTDATGAITYVSCVRFDAPLSNQQGAEIRCEPVAFCLLYRRSDARAAMRTACVELYRLYLSKHPRAFRVLLATLAHLPLPLPQERVDLRVSFIDEDGSMAPLREICVRSSRLLRAGLRSVDDAQAWRAFLAALPPDNLVRVVELALLERPLLVCASSTPSWFLDCLRAVLYPLHWALPCVDRVPSDIGHDLVSGVVPLLAACRLREGAAPARHRCFGEPVDPSVVVVDLDAKEIDFGLKLHASAPRVATTHRRRCCGALRVIGDVCEEGVAIRDVFAQLVSSVLEGHRACLNLQKRDTRRLSVSDIISTKRFARGDPFRCELGETQAFAEFVRRAVEPDVDDGAVDVTVGGLAAQLRNRDEPAIECTAAVTLPSASTEAATWAALVVGDASVDFEDLRMRIQAASASDAATPAERYRRDALAAVGRSQLDLDADPVLSAVRDVAELQFLTLPRFVRRRRTAAQMAWGLLRALGLLRHLLAKRLIPSEAAWRALLLAAGQIKATATDLTVREFARDVARALFREMQAFSITIGPQTFALWSLAVAGDEDEGDATEDDELAAPRLFARSATWSAEDAGNECPWLWDAGAKFCQERDVSTNDLGVLCAKDEDTCYAPGDAFFGRGGSPPTPKLPESSERRIVLKPGAVGCEACGARAPEPAVLAAVLHDCLGQSACAKCGSSGDAVAPTLVVLDSLIGPQVVSYLSPRAIRLEVDARIRRHGEASLAAARVVADAPDVFYSALWWSARLRLPPPFRGRGDHALHLALQSSSGDVGKDDRLAGARAAFGTLPRSGLEVWLPAF